MDSIRPRSLIEYLGVLRRRKWSVIVPALAVMIASATAIKRLPNIYESSTFITVESPQRDDKEGGRSDLASRLGTIKQQVTSRSRLESVINKFALYKNQAGKSQRLDDVISDMRGQVGVDVPTTSDNVTKAFTLSFRDPDPEIARKVTAELASQLIEDNVEAMKSIAGGEAEVYDKRATELKAKLEDIELANPWVLSIREDAPMIPPAMYGAGSGSGSNRATVEKQNADALRNQQMTIEGLKDQQLRIEQQLNEVDKQLAQLRPVVEQQKKVSPLPGNPAYGALIAKRAELEGQRDNLINRQEYTDKHPKVQALNDQIAAIDRQIEGLKQQNAVAISQTPEAIELRRLEAERNKLKIDLEAARRAVDRQVANPPALAVATGGTGTNVAAPATPRDATSARIAQDYLSYKTEYKQVLAKKQDAELKQQSLGSAKVEQYRVQDPANLPQLPIAPNRKLLMGLATLLGLGVGVLFAFGREFKRFSTLQDLKDVEYYTKLPMLVAIPRTLTKEERAGEGRLKKRQMVIGAAAAVLATFMLMGLFIFTNLFALIKK